VTVADSGRKVIFRPGGVRVSSAGIRGIVPSPPPVRSPGGGQGGGHRIGQGPGGGRGHGKGGGNSLAALALALGAASATGGKVVPSPPNVGAVTLICSQVLSAPQASFDTNTILGGNIPASYHHLCIRANLRGTDSSTNRSLQLRFNNDSGTNYVQQLLEGGGSSAVAQGVIGEAQMQIGFVPAATAPANGSAPLTVEIIDYLNTTFFKTALSLDHTRKTTASTGLAVDVFGGSWLSAAAVTRITLLLDAGNFDTGSSFYLYGIT